MLGDLRIEVVEQHPQRRLRLPRPRVQLRPARRANARQVAAERLDESVDRSGDGHVSAPTSSATAAASEPSRMAAATASMSPDKERSSSSGGESERTNRRVAATPAP